MNDMTRSVFLRSPDLNVTDVDEVRQTLRAYFHETFSRYEQLFLVLACDDAWYQKPIALRHPLIFYFGHTATFFVNKMIVAGLVTQRINPVFESMFAIGVDEMSWDDLDASHYDWPSVMAVQAYRDQVRALVDKVLDQPPPALPVNWQHPWWVIVMGIEHERIHLETSSVLIRQQRLDWLRPHPAWPVCRETGQAPADERVVVPEGWVTLGKSHEDAYYGWDNEYGTHQALVPSFSAGRHLVSNQLFLAFVEAGGYQHAEWWTEEGWSWRVFAHAEHPTFWVTGPQGWQLRMMTELVSMPWNWPAEVNYHEAKAWCQWRAATTGEAVRLPTEDEWYRIYDQSGVSELFGDQPATANLHLDWWASSCPVTRFAHGEFYDVVGNVWQWTETPIYPFEGFTVHPYYDDFTVPTFDGRHNLIKGGSWISCGNEVRRTARYAFRRHFFQHAGFRYVVGAALPKPADAYYESDRQLSEYAEFHYGDEYFGVPNFPRALAQIALNAMQGRSRRRALDLGCAVGRASFELAREFDNVTGVDFSARFIQMGVTLATSGSIRYSLVDEGQLMRYCQRDLAHLGLAEIASKVSFFQGDACNLKDLFTGYDLILAANLIDRLYKPMLFLQDVHQRVVTGGLLMIATPWTWLETHTERADWLGGFKRDGENVTGLDGLKAVLLRHFRLIGEPRDVPFVIRETRRKFQHTVSQVTIWERLPDV